MIELCIWRTINRHDKPNNRRCIKNKWVFKIKRNDISRACNVTCGYSQIPDMDFKDNFAPVINDVTYRILLILQIVYGLDAMLIDIETAFLNGDLVVEIYMNLPEGWEGGNNATECIRLEKGMYGLVQSAHQWWRMLVNILKKIGFTGGIIDPCLFYRHSKYGIVIVGLYVNDILTFGNTREIQQLLLDLKQMD